jgi:hypothetical protein
MYDLAEDILVHEDREHPTWLFGIDVTEDESYLILQTSKDTSRVCPTLLVRTRMTISLSYLPEKFNLGRWFQEGDPGEIHSMAEVIQFLWRRIFIVRFRHVYDNLELTDNDWLL